MKPQMDAHEKPYVDRVLAAARVGTLVLFILPTRDMAERFFSVVAFEATSQGMNVGLRSVRNLQLDVDQCCVYFVPYGRDSKALKAMCSYCGKTIVEHDHVRHRLPTSAFILSEFA